MTSTRDDDLIENLRDWAKGHLPSMAAVEFLAASGQRLASVMVTTAPGTVRG